MGEFTCPYERRFRMLSTVLMKLFTVKAVATAAAVTVAGGVTAATVGMATNPDLVHVGDRAGIEVAAAPSQRAAGKNDGRKHDGRKHDGTDGKDADRDKTPAGGKGTGPAGATGSPSPSLVGLCHAVRGGDKAEHGKALQSPAFRVLVTTAGGTDRVDAYCTALLATRAGTAKDDTSVPPAADDPSGADKPGNGRSDKGGPDKQTWPDRAGSDRAGSDRAGSDRGRPEAVLPVVPAGP
jgi:hypothetical protein